MKNIILFILISVFFPSVALSVEKVPKETQELYVKSGLKKQVESFSPILIAQIEAAIKNSPNKNSFKSNNIKTLVKAIRDVFGAGDLNKESLEVLSQELTSAETKKLLDWFDSAVGKKVAWYEDHVATPAGYLAIKDYEKNISKTPPTDDYKATVKKLTVNMNVMETGISIALVNQVLVDIAMASLLPNFTEDMIDKITKQVQQSKPALKQQVATEIDLIMLFTYSHISKEEVNKYLEFTSSPLGKKYFSLMTKSLNLTFQQASIEFREKRIKDL